VAATPDRPSEPGAGAKLYGQETILLIEDDDRVRTAVSRMLQACGYGVLVASSGAEAIELARSYPGTIHRVLSDVIMPGSSGPDVVAAVQELARSARAL
jgi:two-component system, cell cycle sensor histidine kinase and response regulator CckA